MPNLHNQQPLTNNNINRSRTSGVLSARPARQQIPIARLQSGTLRLPVIDTTSRLLALDIFLFLPEKPPSFMKRKPFLLVALALVGGASSASAQFLPEAIASNLVPNDVNNFFDVFVHDRTAVPSLLERP